MKLHAAFARNAALDARVPAPADVTVPPSGFAASYRKRPQHPVKVGLRLLSEKESLDALGHAARDADRPDLKEESWAEVYSAALMCHVLAVACCDPANVEQSYFRDVPNHEIQQAFTPTTIRALWQRYETLQIESSPLTPEADADEAAELARMLTDGGLAIVPRATKRLLHQALVELRAAIDAPDEV